jgi:hypothetical protein
MAAQLAAFEARLVALETGTARRVAEQASSEKAVADDYDLDSEWGDPRIRFGLKEKYWKEQPDPHIGLKYSECEPDYLDATAKYLDACAYMARKNGGEENEKRAKYKSRDAARARGWAARIRKSGAPFATKQEAEEDLDLAFP